MTKTIEQLTTIIAELAAENARLKAESRDACLGLNDYYGRKLAAAQEECEFQRNAHKQAEELMLEQSKQLAAAQKENNHLRMALADTEALELAGAETISGLLVEVRLLKDQLAKAEQRVVEAIVDMLQQKHRNCFGAHSFYLAASVATANGEWRKFVKEE